MINIITPTCAHSLVTNLSSVAVPANVDVSSAIDVGFVEEFDRNASPLRAHG